MNAPLTKIVSVPLSLLVRAEFELRHSERKGDIDLAILGDLQKEIAWAGNGEDSSTNLPMSAIPSMVRFDVPKLSEAASTFILTDAEWAKAQWHQRQLAAAGLELLQEIFAYRPDFHWDVSPAEIVGELIEEAHNGYDLIAHLRRQRIFSDRTFGPGQRTAGICDHIRKELIEIEAAPNDIEEWVDVLLLALDGAWRTGRTPNEVADALEAKLTKNESRTWPDWREVDPNKAIEHVKGA